MDVLSEDVLREWERSRFGRWGMEERMYLSRMVRDKIKIAASWDATGAIMWTVGMSREGDDSGGWREKGEHAG